MGYTIRQIASRFTLLPLSQHRKAFQALRRLNKKNPARLGPIRLSHLRTHGPGLGFYPHH